MCLNLPEALNYKHINLYRKLTRASKRHGKAFFFTVGPNLIRIY
jgi:hypothetical protein